MNIAFFSVTTNLCYKFTSPHSENYLHVLDPIGQNGIEEEKFDIYEYQKDKEAQKSVQNFNEASKQNQVSKPNFINKRPKKTNFDQNGKKLNHNHENIKKVGTKVIKAKKKKNMNRQCEDTHKNCVKWSKNNHCTKPKFVSRMWKNCKFSCKFCTVLFHIPAERPKVKVKKISKKTQIPNCTDKVRFCKKRIKRCDKPIFISNMWDNCRLSCKFCNVTEFRIDVKSRKTEVKPSSQKNVTKNQNDLENSDKSADISEQDENMTCEEKYKICLKKMPTFRVSRNKGYI